MSVSKDDPSDLGTLLSSTNSAYVSAAGALLPFGTLGTYLLLGASGTTHEQLLYEQPIKLPLIELNVPLTTFFVVAPIIFVLLHLYLLVQLLTYARNLRVFEATLRATVHIESDRRLVRHNLSSGLFSLALLDERHLA
jgi:hypothetical protein